ncbi:MAG: hypothetical protein ACJ762_06245 [Solirubrobacteraceae bacterium]
MPRPAPAAPLEGCGPQPSPTHARQFSPIRLLAALLAALAGVIRSGAYGSPEAQSAPRTPDVIPDQSRHPRCLIARPVLIVSVMALLFPVASATANPGRHATVLGAEVLVGRPAPVQLPQERET